MMLTYHISHEKIFSTALYVPGRSGVNGNPLIYYDNSDCSENISMLYTGMRFFRNFPDLRGHSHGNPRSNLIFMGVGGVL